MRLLLDSGSLPVTFKLDAGVSARCVTVVFFDVGDTYFFGPAAGAESILSGDFHFLALIAVVLTVTGKAGGVGGVAISLTFPSSALLGGDTLVSLDLGGLGSVVLVGGWEDAERDRYSGRQLAPSTSPPAVIAHTWRRNPA